MIPEQIPYSLFEFGVLGAWTVSLLYKEYIAKKQTNKVIENNTAALIRMYEAIQKCDKVSK